MKNEFTSRLFWRTHILKAVDPCIMNHTDRPALTVGKLYKPILKELTEKEFAIIDDEGKGKYNNYHWFDWKDYTDYFKIVPRKS